MVLTLGFLGVTPELSMFWGNRDASRWYYVSSFPANHKGKIIDAVMIGDSRAQAAWLPEKGKEHYNLSLGGGTPIEGLKTLEELYDAGIKLKRILISYTPFHLIKEDSYWRRTVNFQYIPFYRHIKLRLLAYELGDSQYFSRGKNYVSHALLGSKTDQIALSLDGTRRKLLLLSLGQITQSQGHSFYGTAASAVGLPEEFENEFIFKKSALVDSQLREMIRLARSKATEVNWLYTPYSEGACKQISEKFKNDYTSYIDSLKVDQLNQFGCFPNDMFGDNSHLYKGAAFFSSKLNEILNK